MRLEIVAALAVAVAVLTAPLSTADARPASKSSTTTHYSKGKPVGKSVTRGNTTTHYSRGKPVAKSITRSSGTTTYARGRPVARSGRR